MLTRLLILWLLSEQPHHGYSIKRILADEGLRFWFPIEDASIYSALRILDKRGHIKFVTTEREGKRPKRDRYAITRAGRAEYSKLLAQSVAELDPPAGGVCAALCAEPDFAAGGFLSGLRVRADALRERLALLKQIERATPAHELVEREQVLATAELGWCEQVIKRTEKENHGQDY